MCKSKIFKKFEENESACIDWRENVKKAIFKSYGQIFYIKIIIFYIRNGKIFYIKNMITRHKT